MKRTMVVASIVMIWVAAIASAQETDMYFMCFTMEQSVASFEKVGDPGVSRDDSDMEWAFILDPQTQKATMSGDVGSTEVMPLINDTNGHESITFLEKVGGGFNITTIFTGVNSRKITPDGLVYPMVHSRHLDLSGAFPSQHYGYCVMKEF